MKYTLGHKAYWLMHVDGTAVWKNGRPMHAQPKEGDWTEYHAAISRLDVELGIDMVNTCTFDIAGEDAAVIAQKLFPRKSKVTIYMGYDYLDGDSQPLTKIFEGIVMQGFPSAGHPTVITIHCDSPLFALRELTIREVMNAPNQLEGLKALMLEQTGLTLLADEAYTNLSGDEGANFEGNVLEETLAWAATNGLHIADMMNGDVRFFYPHGYPAGYFGENPRVWEAAQRGNNDSDVAPILHSWLPIKNYVDAPETISVGWMNATDGSDKPPEITFFTKTIEDGVEGASVHLGTLYTGSKDDAQKLLNDWAANYTWMSVTGTFALATGLPIRPFDQLLPRGGPRGLEDFYDQRFTITNVHHTFDDRGWLVKGSVRGVM